MLAPHPVRSTRGSPIHVWQRLKALSELGYAADLITYPFGETVRIPHVRVYRVPRPWGLQRVRIGPSFAKLPLDAMMTMAAWRALHREDYVAVHSHEEAAWFGVPLSRRFRVPHIYDMHSSLSEQLRRWNSPSAGAAVRVADVLERRCVARSDVVIAISPAILARVRQIGTRHEPFLIENVAAIAEPASQTTAREVRQRYGLGDAPVVVYAGNLEPYQGVSLLLESFALLLERVPGAQLLVVGGDDSTIAAQRPVATQTGIEGAVTFAGAVPFESLAEVLAAADVLACPRIGGAVPMKLYTYLQARRPIVATDIAAHREVLTPASAELAAPNPQAFSAALARVISDDVISSRLIRGAQELASARLGNDIYREKVAAAYAALPAGEVARDAA